MKWLKKILSGLVLILILSAMLLWVTGNKHIFKGAANTYLKGRSGPAIDESEIFANRTVKAGNYQAWPTSVFFNKKKLPANRRKEIESYEPAAYLVIHNDSIVYEEYWDGFDENSKTNSFSMAKSILGVLCGVALKEGKIKSLDEPIGNYIPEFKEGANGKITIKHVLTMSSGINFDEDYVNPFAYPARGYYGDDLRSLTLGKYQAETEPGKIFKYLSGDSQLLAFVIEAATGMKVSDYASEKLWKPLGAKNDAWWNLDKEGGQEKAFCCFNSNAPDFARIGALYLHNGNWKGKQLIDTSYVIASTHPVPGLKEKDLKDCVRYGYQWWMVPDFKGMYVFYMRGILGQYVAVIPEKNLIVVRLGKKRDKPTEKDIYPKDMGIYMETALELIQ